MLYWRRTAAAAPSWYGCTPSSGRASRPTRGAQQSKPACSAPLRLRRSLAHCSADHAEGHHPCAPPPTHTPPPLVGNGPPLPSPCTASTSSFPGRYYARAERLEEEQLKHGQGPTLPDGERLQPWLTCWRAGTALLCVCARAHVHACARMRACLPLPLHACMDVHAAAPGAQHSWSLAARTQRVGGSAILDLILKTAT